MTLNPDNIDWQSLTKKFRIVLPTRYIVTRSSPDRITIASGWKRWILAILMGLLIILSLAPLIFIYFFVPEDHPKYREGLARAIPIAIFSLPLVLLTIRDILSYGKISWRPNSGELTLRFGSWPFIRKLSIPSADFTLKLEMYKADNPKVRIKYGSYILYIYPTDQAEQKLALACTRNLRNARAAYEAIKTIINNASDETPVEKYTPLPTSFPTDPTLKEWNKLAVQSQTKSPFFARMMTQLITSKSCSEDVPNVVET